MCSHSQVSRGFPVARHLDGFHLSLALTRGKSLTLTHHTFNHSTTQSFSGAVGIFLLLGCAAEHPAGDSSQDEHKRGGACASPFQERKLTGRSAHLPTPVRKQARHGQEAPNPPRHESSRRPAASCHSLGKRFNAADREPQQWRQGARGPRQQATAL